MSAATKSELMGSPVPCGMKVHLGHWWVYLYFANIGWVIRKFLGAHGLGAPSGGGSPPTTLDLVLWQFGRTQQSAAPFVSLSEESLLTQCW